MGVVTGRDGKPTGWRYEQVRDGLGFFSCVMALY